MLSYICTPQSSAWEESAKATLRLPNGAYQIAYIQPSNGAVVSRSEFLSRGLGGTAEITVPKFEDDILMLIEKVQAHESTMIEGTR